MKSNRKFSQSMLRVVMSVAVVAGLAGVTPAQNFGGNAGGGGRGNNGGGGRNGGGGGLQTAPVSASYDTRTNTIVLSGPTDVLQKIEDMIREIDANPTQDQATYVYHLKNGSALNIESVAQLVFTGTGGQNRGVSSQQSIGTGRLGQSTTTARGGGGGARGGGLGGAGGGGARGGGLAAGGGVAGGGRAGGGVTFGGVGQTGAGSAAGLVGQVSVVADPNTNSLLVTTHPDNWPRVKLILDQLDRSVPQVMIKVLIAEVTHDNTFDLGAEFSGLNLRTVGSGTLSSQAGTQGGSNFNLPAAGTAQGLIVSITEANFTATLRALETAGKLDVLSRPYILASDNQLATITIGQTVPYVTSSQVTDQGTTNTQVGYTDIGILLDVIPHINPDGLVILDVAPGISAITDSNIQISENFAATVYTNRSVQSRVAVPTGNTVVIGGLMQDRKEEHVEKVPLLGDIPWVGELFKHRRNTKTKTELLIFLTPHVAARPGELEAMGNEEVAHTKLVPNAVGPGAFEEHMRGMEAGEPPPSTQPVIINSDEPIQIQPSQDVGQRGGRGRGPGGGRGGRGGNPGGPRGGAPVDPSSDAAGSGGGPGAFAPLTPPAAGQ
jgi:general secretion pathway protein D